MLDQILDVLASSVRLATPLMFAALGGLLSERSGIVNIALEGKMLVGAFTAAAVTAWTGSPWIGFFAGGVGGMMMALIYGIAVLPLKANQIVAGTGINMLAIGAVPFAGKVLYDVTGSTPALAIGERFAWEPMPLAFGALIVVATLMRMTRAGLWIRFAGEHPTALAAAGVDVQRVRWASVLAAGFLAGLGGASLSIFLASSFSRNMTAGRGFIALAALILGKWRAVPAVLACLFFGLADAVQIRMQGLEMFGAGQVPVQFIQILPYVVTLLLLAGFVGRARAPKALGV